MLKKYRIKSNFRFMTFITILTITMIFLGSTAVGSNKAISLSEPEYNYVNVVHGDTLWEIAGRFGPENADIRKTVYKICELNDISAEGLVPGQTLIVPVYL